MNFCTACGQDFNSVTLFDRHRVGVHEYTYEQGLRMNPIRENGRRCLTVDEMTERGWALNARERWSDPARKEVGQRLRPASPSSGASR